MYCTHLWLHGCPLTCWLLPTMPFSNTDDALRAVASSIAEALPSTMGSLNTVSLILSSHFRQRWRGLVATDRDQIITIRQTSFLSFWNTPSCFRGHIMYQLLPIVISLPSLEPRTCCGLVLAPWQSVELSGEERNLSCSCLHPAFKFRLPRPSEDYLRQTHVS